MTYVPRFKVGDRLSITNENCTVLFVGQIDAWPDEVAYGVEWDNAARGKHSGSIANHTYFSTAFPNSGSFLKAKKVDTICDATKSFFRAINERYQSQFDTLEIAIGDKRIEQLGFDKLNLINLKWFELSTISLSSCYINSAGVTTGNEAIKVKDLDLSKNLFDDFSDVLSILGHFRQLESLNLAENRFHRYGQNKIMLANLESLRVSGCFLKWREINDILSHFPNLKKLDLSNNLLSDSDLSHLKIPISLKSLDVSGNDLTTVLPSINRLNNLAHLNISYTRCMDIFGSVNAYAIDTLYLNGLTIPKWDCLDNLSSTFPRLRQLRCDFDKFPVEGLKAEFSSFDAAVAQFGCLQVLNGSLINEKARQDSELYFIAKVQEEVINYSKDFYRWKDLLIKYGISDDRDIPKTNWLVSDVITVPVKINYNKAISNFKLQLFTGSSVRYIKGLLSARLKIPVYQFIMKYETPAGKLKDIPREFSCIGDFSIEPEGALFIDLLPDI